MSRETSYRRYLAFMLAGLAATAMSGCATLAPEQAAAQKAQANVVATSTRHAPKPMQVVTHYNFPYLMGTPIAALHHIPAVLKQNVVLNTGRPLYLTQVAEQISNIVSIPVHVTHLRNPNPKAQSQSSMTGSAGMTGGASMGEAPGMMGSQLSPAMQIDPQYIQARVHWSGPLNGLLDSLAARYGVSWRFRHGQIELFKYETRTFSLGLSQRNSNMGIKITSATASSSSTGSSGSGGGSTAITDSNSAKLTPYSDVLSSVKSMIGYQGVANVSPALSTVTVTTTPSLMSEVADYVHQQNTRADRNILVNVKIYQVQTTDSVDMAASMSAVLDKLGQGVTASILGSPASDSSSLMSAIVGSNVPSGLGNGGFEAMSSNGGSLSASQAVLRALHAIGTTNLVTTGQVMTSNGEPGPIQDAQEINFVSSSDSSLSNGTTSTSLQSSGLTVGFTGNFLPRLVGKHRILLSYQMQLSSLLDMKSVTSAGTTIQLPQVSKQTASQSVVLKSGQTLVLASFGSNSNQRGSGLGLLSGYHQNEQGNTWLVIMIGVSEVKS